MAPIMPHVGEHLRFLGCYSRWIRNDVRKERAGWQGSWPRKVDCWQDAKRSISPGRTFYWGDCISKRMEREIGLQQKQRDVTVKKSRIRKRYRLERVSTWY